MDENSWKEDTLAGQRAVLNSSDCGDVDVAGPGMIANYPGLFVVLNSHFLSSRM